MDGIKGLSDKLLASVREVLKTNQHLPRNEDLLKIASVEEMKKLSKKQLAGVMAAKDSGSDTAEELSPKQKKIASLSGDKNKIDSSDLAKLRKKIKPFRDAAATGNPRDFAREEKEEEEQVDEATVPSPNEDDEGYYTHKQIHGKNAVSKDDWKKGIRKPKASDKQVKMATGISHDKRYAGGNMTGAVSAIEKIRKNLSKHPRVAASLKAANEEEEEQVDEVLGKGATAADYIHDFVKSKNPKFDGKSKKERIRMALGASYAARNDDADDADDTDEAYFDGKLRSGPEWGTAKKSQAKVNATIRGREEDKEMRAYNKAQRLKRNLLKKEEVEEVKGQTPTRRSDKLEGDLKVVRPIKESYNGETATLATPPTNYDNNDAFDPKKHHVFSLTNKSPYSSITQYFHAKEGKDALRKSHRIDPHGDPKIAYHKPGTPEHDDYVKAHAASSASRKSMDVETIKALVARHGIKHKGKPLNPKAIHEEELEVEEVDEVSEKALGFKQKGNIFRMKNKTVRAFASKKSRSLHTLLGISQRKRRMGQKINAELEEKEMDVVEPAGPPSVEHQLRKSISLRGMHPVAFENGETHKVPSHVAQHATSMIQDTPVQHGKREAFIKKLNASPESFYKHIGLKKPQA